MTYLSSQHHSFDILLAAKYGVEEAILIHHFQHWIRINQVNGNNIQDGHCWTYQTRKDICARFPYWNVDRVKYLCEKLVEHGILITANYNKLAIDKTLWYAFADEKAFAVNSEISKILYEGQKCLSKGKSAFPEGKSAQAIPDTKPNTITKESVCPTSSISENIPTKIKKRTSDGNEIEANQDDVFRKAIQMKKDWSTEEIASAWEALCNAKLCNDIWKYIEGTIKKIRVKVNFQKMQKAVSKNEKVGDKECLKQNHITEPPSLDILKLLSQT